MDNVITQWADDILEICEDALDAPYSDREDEFKNALLEIRGYAKGMKKTLEVSEKSRK